MKKLILAVCAALLVPAAATAEQTEGVGGAIAYGETTGIATTGAFLTMTSSGATAQRIVFPAGGEAHLAFPFSISVDGAGFCFYSARTSGVTASSGKIMYAGRTTLDGPTAGIGFDAAGQASNQIADWDFMYNEAGNALGQKGAGDVSHDAVGLCTSVTYSEYGVDLHPPCVTDGDCSSGSCDESPTDAEKSKAGIYVMCASDASTITAKAHIEKLIVR